MNTQATAEAEDWGLTPQENERATALLRDVIIERNNLDHLRAINEGKTKLLLEMLGFKSFEEAELRLAQTQITAVKFPQRTTRIPWGENAKMALAALTDGPLTLAELVDRMSKSHPERQLSYASVCNALKTLVLTGRVLKTGPRNGRPKYSLKP